VKYVRDATGRFGQRPHFEPVELDNECEQIITDFLRDLYGHVAFPVQTDALTKLIERDAADLDLYADLSTDRREVEGVTHFYADRKPRVEIARELSEQPRREHRLRTTLTHEYGHVKFHAHLWQADPAAIDMFEDRPRPPEPRCERNNIINAAASDWMEWQAGYVCGAILMPRSALRRIALQALSEQGIEGAAIVGTASAQLLETAVAVAFDVSGEAARVRMLKLGFLTDGSRGRSLFA
jgi:Zn-dependent peptidase ImmA (M78 family)